MPAIIATRHGCTITALAMRMLAFALALALGHCLGHYPGLLAMQAQGPDGPCLGLAMQGPADGPCLGLAMQGHADGPCLGLGNGLGIGRAQRLQEGYASDPLLGLQPRGCRRLRLQFGLQRRRLRLQPARSGHCCEKRDKRKLWWNNDKLDQLLKLPEPMNITVNIVY